jgi:predicted Ser/Thr protein kinase
MASNDPVAVAPSLPAGTLILDGRFRLHRLLGEGGMGLVYLAEQVSLGRPVAVKVLRDDLSLQAGMSERFRREAKLLSQVEHSAVVRVIDFGMHGASACLVMEYAEGETLEQALRAGPLPVERALPLLIQLCQGLTAIHDKGIVHRDLKPENVVLTRSAGGEQARLLDFGIARLAAPESPGSVTQVGLVLGTPEVVSPEQAMGQVLDARSDLYSLGVVAYRMLSGVLPFPGPSPQEFIAQHVQRPPRALVEAAPSLTAQPALASLVMSCLEKSRESRPQTALALAGDFAKVAATGANVPAPMLLAATASGFLAHTLPGDDPAWAAAPNYGLGAADEVLAAAPGPAPRRRSGLWLTLAAVTLLIAAGLAWWNAPALKVRRLIEAGRGSEALQVIDDVAEDRRTWPLKMLKAAALHQVNRHDDEVELMRGVPEAEAMEPLALEGLAEDFARKETVSLRKLMASFPKQSALPALQALAQGEPGKAQWGALRFVDQEYAGQGLPLVALYIRALESNECRLRAIAAKRLGELRNAEAVEPLKKLKDVPKKKLGGLLGGEEDCGHGAAVVALKQLERELNP